MMRPRTNAEWREWSSQSLAYWFWIYVQSYRANTRKIMWRYSIRHL